MHTKYRNPWAPLAAILVSMLLLILVVVLATSQDLHARDIRKSDYGIVLIDGHEYVILQAVDGPRAIVHHAGCGNPSHKD